MRGSGVHLPQEQKALLWIRRPLALLAVACGTLLLLQWSAPSYLFRQGFPLDDSWIHAVYAREFARSWLLAYNPGVAATGETSPLWAMVLAPIHRWAPTVEAVVAATKVFGFALHATAAATIAWTVSLKTRETQSFVWFGAALALVHPDLVAASVSGMEVPLASLMVAVVVAGVIHGSWPTVMISAMLATLSRPEAAVIAASFPIFLARDGLLSSLRLSTAAVGGAATATVAVGVRNYYVSGLFLPATFHAKVGTSALFDVSSLEAGLRVVAGAVRAAEPSGGTACAALYVCRSCYLIEDQVGSSYRGRRVPVRVFVHGRVVHADYSGRPRGLLSPALRTTWRLHGCRCVADDCHGGLVASHRARSKLSGGRRADRGYCGRPSRVAESIQAPEQRREEHRRCASAIRQGPGVGFQLRERMGRRCRRVEVLRQRLCSRPDGTQYPGDVATRRTGLP